MKTNNYFFIKSLGLFFLILIAASPVFAQIKISGRVTSSGDGQPIIGASVRVKNAAAGTVTDPNGNFFLTVPKNSLLLVSYVGFEEQEIGADHAGTYAVSLKPSKKALNEVVVTALGIKKDERRIGYAVQKVEGEDLVKAREPNPVNSLVGKVAGLNIGINDELLGAPQVLLRGSQVYLYVVDGVPVNSDTWNISPDDIETITVLKGPSAAALYGNRAQNGAILITTKKGKENKKGWTVEVNSSTQFNKGFIAIPKVQNEYGPGELQKYAFVDGKGGGLNDGDYDVWGPKFEGQPIPQYDSPVDPVTGKRTPTPWVARGKDNLQHFIQTGILSTNNVALSSVTDKGNLRLSVTNTYQRGIVPNTRLNTVNFNFYGATSLSDRVKVEANINYNRQTSPNFPDVQYGPNSIIYNIDIWSGADYDVRQLRNYWQPGKVGIQSLNFEYQRYHNPWFMSYEWLRGHYKTDIYGYALLNYKITNDLAFTLRSGISTYNIFRNEKMPWSAHPYGREGGLGDYREDRRDLFENNTEAFLTFTKDVYKGIELNVVAGGNARNFRYNSGYTTTNYLNVPEVYSFDNTRNPLFATSFNSKMLVLSGYYSVDLTVKNYFTLSTTGREDKSSALLPQHNAFFYPSVSLSSVISDYVRLPQLISFFKLRASYANIKNEGPNVSQTIGATPNAGYPLGYGAQYYSTYGGPVYSLSSTYATQPLYNNSSAAYYTTKIIDQNIISYNRSNYEGGLEVKFLNNRLGLDATYFEYIDGPQIFPRAVSQTSGFTNYVTNAVKTTTNGWELTLSGTPVKQAGGFNWNVLVNWSTYKDRYTELPSGQNTIFNYFHKGDRVDALWGASLLMTPDGKVIHDGSGIPIENPYNTFLGYENPDWIWGVNNRFSYKNFAFSFQFDGRVGGTMRDYIKYKLYQGGRAVETVQGRQGIARNEDFKNADNANYQGVYVGDGVVVSNNVPVNIDPATGKITNYSQLQFTANTHPAILQNYDQNYYVTGTTLMSKTYAKLREVVFTYNLPQELLKNTFIRTLNISLVGRNLLYFVNSAHNDVDLDQYAGAVSGSSLQTPTTRSYGVNIGMTF